MIAVAGLPLHRDKDRAGADAAGIVLHSGDRRIAALREHFRALEQLLEGHRSDYKQPGFSGARRRDAGHASCWNRQTVYAAHRDAARRVSTPEMFYLPNLTITRDPAATFAPGAGDCSRATPLPTASRSSPASCAASTAARTFLPKNEGTAM